MTTYRQGDVLIVKINALPKGAKQLPKGRIILADGEVTGHRHEILEGQKVNAYQLAEGLYLEVAEEVAVQHPEHAQVALLPGTYEVIRQQEFQRGAFQRVSD